MENKILRDEKYIQMKYVLEIEIDRKGHFYVYSVFDMQKKTQKSYVLSEMFKSNDLCNFISLVQNKQ